MDKQAIKNIKDNIKALQATEDVQLVRQVDAYFTGVMTGYEMAKRKEETDGKISND